MNDKRKKLQFPVAHMVSERHNNIAIAFWLQCWLRAELKMPKICVTDESRALMMACVRAFTQYSTLNQYILVCSSLLKGEDRYETPFCMMRNDFANLMHLISTWKEIKYAPRKSKHFYLWTVALIIASASFEDIKHLLKCFFIVLLNEEEGFDNHHRPCSCENAKKFLKLRIAGQVELDDSVIDDVIAESEFSDICDEATNVDEKEGKVGGTSVFDEICDIYESIKREVPYNHGDRDNLQFCPELAKKFLDFTQTIVIWSAIMVPIFSYGMETETSSASESLFKELKRNIFNDKQLPVRLDDFIPIHIEYVTGKCNLVGARQLKEEKFENMEQKFASSFQEEDNKEGKEEEEEKGNIVRGDDIEEENCSQPLAPGIPFENEAEENWRGQNIGKKGKKSNKPNYLELDPSILSHNWDSKCKSSSVGHLRNGCTPELKGIKLDDQYYTINYTCTFGSISQVILCAYADSDQ